MERDSNSRFGHTYYHSQRIQQEVNPIIDDPKSSNPHSLLPWLKRQLKMFAPANNSDYIPTLPTAS